MTMANVGAYIGISRNPEGFLAEEQKQKLETWAKENNAAIRDFYIDNESDKLKPIREHQEFKRLLNDIGTHRIDSILSIDYGRLTDNNSDLSKTLDELQQKGVKVYSITDAIRGT